MKAVHVSDVSGRVVGSPAAAGFFPEVARIEAEIFGVGRDDLVGVARPGAALLKAADGHLIDAEDRGDVDLLAVTGFACFARHDPQPVEHRFPCRHRGILRRVTRRALCVVTVTRAFSRGTYYFLCRSAVRGLRKAKGSGRGLVRVTTTITPCGRGFQSRQPAGS
jgi:hypothetical protein